MSKAKYDEVDASRVGLVIAEVSCDEAGAGLVVGDDDGDGSLIYLCVLNETPSQFKFSGYSKSSLKI